MSVKNIIQYPNKVLLKKSKKIENLVEAKNIAKDLLDTLNASKIPGAGLAAPQIGISKNICVVRKFYNKDKYKDIVLINPNILKTSKELVNSLEGCLSIEDTYGYVYRHKKIKIEYTNLQGIKKTLKAEGFLSRVIQHEMDHLEGILFIQKLIDGKTYTEKELENQK